MISFHQHVRYFISYVALRAEMSEYVYSFQIRVINLYCNDDDDEDDDDNDDDDVDDQCLIPR